MTLHAFLIFWLHFVATHYCDVWLPDPSGLGNHIVYEGSCTTGVWYAQHLHATLTWSGITQGLLTFP